MDSFKLIDYGISVFVTVSFMSLFTWIIKKEFTRLNNTIASLSKYIGKTNLTGQQQSFLFDLIMQSHIRKKIQYIKKVLEENNLKAREPQIKANIETVFKEITQKEISYLLTFNCPFAEMLNKIDWPVFLSEIYAIIWSDNKTPQKLSDCEILMQGYISEMQNEAAKLKSFEEF